MANTMSRTIPLFIGLMLVTPPRAGAGGEGPDERELVGWGWQDRPHGQTLASDVLGQFAEGDPRRPHFGSYGPYGGPSRHGFFMFAFNAGRYQVAGGPAAHRGARKLAVPDYWNQRVLLFDLNEDGALASRSASRIIGQERFDTMEIGQGPDRLHFPSACCFSPDGRWLFVADEYNHRVLQFDVGQPQRAVRVYGQPDFNSWGYDGSPGDLVWDSTREDVRGPKLVRSAHARGLFLPRGVACDGKRLYVSDGDNHRVLVFDATGTENGPSALAVLGQADFSGYRPNRGGERGPETMLFPGGLALDSAAQCLLVADSMNERLLIFDVTGELQNGMAAMRVLARWGSDPDDLPFQPEGRNITGILDVAVDDQNRVYLADRPGQRVLVHSLEDILAGREEPLAGIGKFEMNTDLRQSKSGYTGPTGLAVAGGFLYVVEPRGNRVLCFNTANPEGRAVDLLGQFFGNDLARPDFNKYGPNNGPDPYGFDFADGSPALSVTEDGHWLLAADTIGGRLLFFPLGPDGLPLDRSARFVLGVPTLTARANNYGAQRFNRPSHSVLTAAGRLFASDFQGSRILYFELPDFVAATGRLSLEPPRPFISPVDRPPAHREEFEFRSITSGMPALHVLGQKDFQTGLRGVATQQQMGKEMSGLIFDRKRQWLFIAEKLNHRVLIVDVSGNVSTYMPAMAVLGQPDFTSNAPNWGQSAELHPAGMTEPSGVCYDHRSQTLFVTSGASRDEREILGFDLSGEIANGMEPTLRIGGRRATVMSDLPFVERTLAIDEDRRRLWTGLFAVDLSGDFTKAAPLLGWFGLGAHPDADSLQGYHTGELPNLLGYSVGFCHRFGGAVNATAVNPQTGTVYVADNARYRILCFQPEFEFSRQPIRGAVSQPLIALTGTGGLSPLQFRIDAGTLPEGLELDPRTGIIRGTPRGPSQQSRIGLSVQTAGGPTRGELVIQIKSR